MGSTEETMEMIVEPSQEVAIATVRVTPQQAKDAVENIRAVIEQVLTEGRDFATIPGTKKPSLLKPGAEALQRFFGLGCEIAESETGTLETGGFYARTRVAIKNRDGMTLGESDGWADQDEAKWKKAPRNTIISMAHKRAYVAAIRTATGTSDFFTDSLEDHAPAGPATAPPGMILLDDAAASKEDVEAFLEFFQEKRGEESNVYVVEWLRSHQKQTAKGAVSFWWLGKVALSLLKLPVAGPHAKEQPEKEPELPVDPPQQGTIDDSAKYEEITDAEVVSDDDIPFLWLDMFGRKFGGEHWHHR